MAASADVLAQAKVEIDLSSIPEGKNVRYFFNPTSNAPSPHLTRLLHRSLSNGAESPSLSVTAPNPKSPTPATPSGNPYATLNPTKTVYRSPNGSSWSVYAHTWDVYQLVRLVTLEAGSVLATVRTTTFLDARGRDLHH